MFDAASNIRDGQGTLRDYADFFRNSKTTEEEARQGGILSRAKGQGGFDLGRFASNDLYSLYRAEKITEPRAIAIARAAPNDPQAQQIGIKYALEKKDPAFITNIIKASGAESVARGGVTMDLFGADDAVMQEMERRANRASQFQQAFQDRITAAQSAAKRPEAAKKMGIDVSDPEAVRGKIAELKAELGKWQNWPMHPELVGLVTGDTDPADVVDSVADGPAVEKPDEPTQVRNGVDKTPPGGETNGDGHAEDTAAKPRTPGETAQAEDFRGVASALGRGKSEGEREGAPGARPLDYVREWAED